MGFETKSLGSGPNLLTGEPICDLRIITFDIRKSIKLNHKFSILKVFSFMSGVG